MKKKNQLIRHVNIHAQQLKALVDPIRVVYALNWSCCASDVGFCNKKLLVPNHSVYTRCLNTMLKRYLSLC